MTTLKEIRERFPAYNDLSDQQLADALHQKHYSDIPKEDFYGRIGFQTGGFGDMADASQAVRPPGPRRTAPAMPAMAPPAPGGPSMSVPPMQPMAPAAGLMDLMMGAAPVGTNRAGVGFLPTAGMPAEGTAPYAPAAPQMADTYRPDIPFDPRALPQPGQTAPQQVAPAAPAQPDPFAGESLLDLLKRRGQQFARGAGEIVAGIPEAAAIAGTRADIRETEGAAGLQDQRAQMIAEMQARLADPNLPPDQRAFIERNLADLTQGQEVLGDMASAPIVPTQERPAYAMGDKVRGAVEGAVGAPDPRDTSFWGKLAEGGGSMVGFVATSLLGSAVAGPVGGVAAGAVAGAGVNAAQVYRDAIQSGASEDQALAASRLAALLGSTEVVPIGRALDMLPGGVRSQVTNRLVKRLIEAGAAGGEEAIQEAINGIGNNLIAKGIYDPQRGVFDDVGEQALVGAILGGGLGAIAPAMRPGPNEGAAPGGPQAPQDGQPDEPFNPGGRGPSRFQLTPPPDEPQAPAGEQPVERQAAPEAPAQPAAAQAPDEPAPPAPVEEQQTEPAAQDGRFEILDEVETVGNETRPTGRKVRLDLDTGEVSPVDEAETPAPVAERQPPSAPREVGPEAEAAAGATNIEGVRGEPDAQGRPGPVYTRLDSATTQRIKTDPQTFQYKGGGDAEGVTDTLRSVSRFDPKRAGQVILYERENGDLVVADGHQRTGLARRAAAAGQGDVGGMAALIYKEADGYSPREVMVEAALANIGQGTGTALDAARVFRSIPGKTLDDLNLPKQPDSMARRGMALSNLSDDAFGMVANGVASERDGGIVGRVVADKDMQADILDLLTKMKLPNEFQAESVARQAAEASQTETQTDMFGAMQVKKSLYRERAKVLDTAIKMLRQDKRTFQTLVDRGATITSEGGNVLDQDANAARLEGDAAVLQYLSSQANRKGPISDALTQAAEALAGGQKLSASAEGFVNAVRRADFGRSEAGAPAPQDAQREGAGRRAPEVAPKAPFSTLEQAREWFEAGQAKYGKRGFTATDEYKAHYEAFRALYDADKPARDARREARRQSQEGQPASLLGHAMRGTPTERTDAGEQTSEGLNEDDLFGSLPDQTGKAQRDKAEMDARARQSKMRTGRKQDRVEGDPGSLFGYDRQGDLLSGGEDVAKYVGRSEEGDGVESMHSPMPKIRRSKAGDDARAWIMGKGIRALTAREYGVAIDKNGDVVTIGRGSQSAIGFGAALAETTDPDAGIVFHHNHPRNSSFSSADISAMANGSVRAVYAYGPDGAIFRAEMTPAGRAWVADVANRALGAAVERSVADAQMNAAAVIRRVWSDAAFVVQDHIQSWLNANPQTFSDEAAMADLATRPSHAAMEALHEHGLVVYEARNRPAAVVDVPGMDDAMQRAREAAREALESEDFRRDDRPAKPVRYAGDLEGFPSRDGEPAQEAPRERGDVRPGDQVGSGADSAAGTGAEGQARRGSRSRKPEDPRQLRLLEADARFAEDSGLTYTKDQAVYGTPLDIFYSPLLRAVEGAKQKSAPAKDWLAILSKSPGVKKAEMDWLGIEDFLAAQDGQVTREELTEFIRGSQIQIVEDRLGGDGSEIVRPDQIEVYIDYDNEIPGEDDDAPMYRVIVSEDNEGVVFEGDFDGDTYFLGDLGDFQSKSDVAVAAARELTEQRGGGNLSGPAGFESYTESGGENYREILLRMPNLHQEGPNRVRLTPEQQAEWDEINQKIRDLAPRGYLESDHPNRAEHDRLYDERERMAERHGLGKSPFVQSAHFEQENIVVHARVKDRRGPNGERVLFVEEIQSDLGTKWREASESPEVTARRRELMAEHDRLSSEIDRIDKSIRDAIRPEFDADQMSLATVVNSALLDGNRGDQRAISAIRRSPEAMRLAQKRMDVLSERRKVDDERISLGTDKSVPADLPRTPFENENYYALMVKRLLRMAADEGYDRLSWTPGYMQAERWNAAAQSVVEGVEWVSVSGRENGAVRAVQLGMGQGGLKAVSVNAAGVIVDGPDILLDKQLSSLIGPGLAKRVMTEDSGSVSGQKITFPDSGYAIAYDQHIRKAVDKIAKKGGARVYEDKTLPDMANRDSAGRLVVDPVWSVDITDKLRDIAREPLSIMQTPIAGAAHVDPEVARKALPRLRAELDRLNLQRVRIGLDESGRRRQGAFEASRFGAMDILIGQSLDPDKTMYHEAVHAMRFLDLFTPAEWEVLTKEAERKWLEQYDIATRYPNLLPEERIEEAIAEAYADAAAARKRPPNSVIARAFSKMYRLFRAIRTAFKGLDADEVFLRAYAGEIGARDAGNTGFVADVQAARNAVGADGERPLYVVHNTSAEKLRHAIDLGGMPAPSLAIARGDIGFDSFGDISLIGAPDLADPKGRGGRTFNADVYSPRQPRARYDINARGYRAAMARIDQAATDIQSSIGGNLDMDKISREGLDAFAYEDAVQLAYLREIGDAPKVRYKKEDPLPKEMRKWARRPRWEIANDAAFRDLVEKRIVAEAQELPEDLRDKVIASKTDDMKFNRIVENWAMRVAEYGGPRRVDGYETSRAIRQRMDKTKKRRAEFRAWIEDNFRDVLGPKFFNTDAGRRKPYQMDALLREMTKTIRDGEGFNYGVGSIRSMVAGEFKSLKAIKASRGDIVSEADMKAMKDEASNELSALADRFAPYHASSDGFGWLDIFSEFLKDLSRGRLREWQTSIFDQPAPPELISEARQFLGKLSSMPTEYFEVKMKRAVGLGDFEAALVPKGTPKDIRDALTAAGVEVVDYTPDNEGRGRTEALQKIGNKVFFQSPQRTNTDTPEFRRWFGDSKVVDENGDPLVVYHGTAGDFARRNARFRTDAVGRGAGDWSGKGFYFTPDELEAQEYGPNVVPAYLSLQNPYVHYLRDYNWRAPDDWSEHLQKQGHDGVIVRVKDVDDRTGEVAADWIKEIVAFRPEQIKSVFNRGGWNPNDARIMEQRAWHGTGNYFDTFEREAGRRNRQHQAAGEGHYFALNRDDAEYYRKMAASAADGKLVLLKDGRPVTKEDFTRSLGKILGYSAHETYRMIVNRISGSNTMRHDRDTFREINDRAIREMLRDTMQRVEQQLQSKAESRRAAIARRKAESEDLQRLGFDPDLNDMSGESYRFVREDMVDRKRLREAQNYIESLSVGVNASQGFIYLVDIPETTDLMDWNAPVGGRPTISKAVDEIIRAYPRARLNSNMPGAEFYKALAQYSGSEKQASAILNGRGIKGHAFRHGEGTAYVIYDGSDVKILNRQDPSEGLPTSRDQAMPARQRPSRGPGPLLGAPHIPDRRVWDELTAANRSIWQRVKGGASAAHDAADRARVRVQDRFLPVLRAQQAIERYTGQRLPDELNAYEVETTFSGKAGRHLDVIDREFTKPVLDILSDRANKDLDVQDVGAWLAARHAEERNKRIAQINKAMPDGAAGTTRWKGQEVRLTNSEARRILREAAAGPHAAALQQIGALVDAQRERTLALRVDAGLISQEDADALRAMYKHYVPLQGFAETDNAEAAMDALGVGREQFLRTGSRYSIRGKETRNALGRQSEAWNPLLSMQTQAQETAIRAEKNRVAQAVYRLAEQYPSPNLWEVKGVKQKRYFNKTTGMVETRVEGPVTMNLQPNEMAVKIGGVEKRIVFHDERLTRALGQVGADELSAPIAMAAAFNRFLSMFITTLDPEFVIRNAFRDITAAAINISEAGGDDAAAIRKGMVKNWRKAFMGAFGGMGGKENTVWQKHYKEFVEAGGKVHFFQMENPQASAKDFEKRLSMARSPAAIRAMRVIANPKNLFSDRYNPVLEFVERSNLAVDNAVRLAAFVEARKLGWSPQKAANLAKNLTVNFNRRGSETSWLNALYLFFNAAVQGLQVTTKAMMSKKGLAIGGGMVLEGLARDFINAWLSDDDEDGELAYDKLPDYKTRMNWVLMARNGGNDAITIPLPYIYAVFPYMGTQIGKVMRGVKSPAEALGGVFLASLEQTAPIQVGDFSEGSEQGFRSVLPTALQPVFEVSANMDWMGRPIRPEDPFGDYGPNAYKYYSSVSNAAKWMADVMNRGTGGTVAESGIIDVSPEYIDHISGFLTGGAGRFVGRNVDLAISLATGEPVEARSIPMARQLVYDTGDWLDSDRYYRFREEVRTAAQAVEDAAAAGIKVSPDKKRLATLEDAMREAEKLLRETRKAKRAIDASNLPVRDKVQRKEAIYKRENGIYLTFNKRFIRVMGPQGE